MAALDEFVEAQDRIWPDPLVELRSGMKRSHWIWFVFPQLASLGRSTRARHFGLSSIDEAASYLAHPTLGSRLVEAASALLSCETADPEEILGPTDAMKVRSSMTLFAAVDGAPPEFDRVLTRFYHDEPCPLTRQAIGEA